MRVRSSATRNEQPDVRLYRTTASTRADALVQRKQYSPRLSI